LHTMNNLKINGMNTSLNNYDAIEKMIYDEGLRIEAIDFHPELDVMLIVLNTKAVLHQKLSPYQNLKGIGKDVLLKYELINNGTGIHWSSLDEDLSLKGFLRDELRNVVKNNDNPIAA
jgi:hypothetical protein